TLEAADRKPADPGELGLLRLIGSAHSWHASQTLECHGRRTAEASRCREAVAPNVGEVIYQVRARVGTLDDGTPHGVRCAMRSVPSRSIASQPSGVPGSAGPLCSASSRRASISAFRARIWAS